MQKQHLFLVLDGIDCSGKTYLINLLKNKIPNEKSIVDYFDNNIIYTYEPGGINLSIGDDIRKLIFKNKSVISSMTEALLFFAARAEHLNKVIIPALKNNSLIICDRYFLSTIVYQGQFGNNDFEWLTTNMNYISKGVNPDITFFLDVTKTEYEQFFAKKNTEHMINSFDLAYSDYETTRQAYLNAIEYMKTKNKNIVSIKNLSTADEKAEYIIHKIKEFIK